MDTTTMIVIAVVIGLVLLYLFNRNRVAPRGTYDDPNKRSSGSIGGGSRAYDDPNVKSSGSIGGGPRSYDAPSTQRNDAPAARSTTGSGDAQRPKHDDPNVKSGGSFGG